MSGFDNGFQDSEGGTQVKARLKWFNATKGFGFVSPMDGASDAFLHVSVLHRAGLQQLGDQAELLVEVGPGPKGPQVMRIVEVLSAGESSPPRQGDGSGSGSYGGGQRDHGGYSQAASGFDGGSASGDEMGGVVKWFKADKGFGFITADGSGNDVFVHKSVLMRSGLHSLEAGQRVSMRVQEVEKGREATWISSN